MAKAWQILPKSTLEDVKKKQRAAAWSEAKRIQVGKIKARYEQIKRPSEPELPPEPIQPPEPIAPPPFQLPELPVESSPPVEPSLEAPPTVPPAFQPPTYPGTTIMAEQSPVNRAAQWAESKRRSMQRLAGIAGRAAIPVVGPGLAMEAAGIPGIQPAAIRRGFEGAGQAALGAGKLALEGYAAGETKGVESAVRIGDLLGDIGKTAGNIAQGRFEGPSPAQTGPNVPPARPPAEQRAAPGQPGRYTQLIPEGVPRGLAGLVGEAVNPLRQIQRNIEPHRTPEERQAYQRRRADEWARWKKERENPFVEGVGLFANPVNLIGPGEVGITGRGLVGAVKGLDEAQSVATGLIRGAAGQIPDLGRVGREAVGIGRGIASQIVPTIKRLAADERGAIGPFGKAFNPQQQAIDAAKHYIESLYSKDYPKAKGIFKPIAESLGWKKGELSNFADDLIANPSKYFPEQAVKPPIKPVEGLQPLPPIPTSILKTIIAAAKIAIKPKPGMANTLFKNYHDAVDKATSSSNFANQYDIWAVAKMTPDELQKAIDEVDSMQTVAKTGPMWEVFDPWVGKPDKTFTTEADAVAYAKKHGLDYGPKGEGWTDTVTTSSGFKVNQEIYESAKKHSESELDDVDDAWEGLLLDIEAAGLPAPMDPHGYELPPQSKATTEFVDEMIEAWESAHPTGAGQAASGQIDPFQQLSKSIQDILDQKVETSTKKVDLEQQVLHWFTTNGLTPPAPQTIKNIAYALAHGTDTVEYIVGNIKVHNVPQGWSATSKTAASTTDLLSKAQAIKQARSEYSIKKPGITFETITQLEKEYDDLAMQLGEPKSWDDLLASGPPATKWSTAPDELLPDTTPTGLSPSGKTFGEKQTEILSDIKNYPQPIRDTINKLASNQPSAVGFITKAVTMIGKYRQEHGLGIPEMANQTARDSALDQWVRTSNIKSTLYHYGKNENTFEAVVSGDRMLMGRDAGFHAGPFNAALDRMRAVGSGGYMLPLKVNLQRMYRMNDMGSWHLSVDRWLDEFTRGQLLKPENRAKWEADADNWLRINAEMILDEKGITYANLTPEQILSKLSTDDQRKLIAKWAFETLESKGYDAIVYKNAVEAVGEDSYIIFNPQKMKSIFGGPIVEEATTDFMMGIQPGIGAAAGSAGYNEESTPEENTRNIALGIAAGAGLGAAGIAGARAIGRIRSPRPIPTPTGSSLLADIKPNTFYISSAYNPDWIRRLTDRLDNPITRPIAQALGEPSRNLFTEASIIHESILADGKSSVAGAISFVRQYGSSNKLFNVDKSNIATIGGVRAAINDVLEYPDRYTLTPDQRTYATTIHKLYDDARDLLTSHGIDVHELGMEPGGHYVGRRVMGREDSATGEIIRARIDPNAPPRTGSIPGMLKERVFKTQDEAIKEGFRYLSPEETLQANLTSAYRRIADERLANHILSQIPYRTAKVPSALVVARDFARAKLDIIDPPSGSKKFGGGMLAVINRGYRGERLPMQTIKAIGKYYPDQAKKMLDAGITKLEDLSLRSKLQDVEADIPALAAQAKADFYAAKDALTEARKFAKTAHFLESQIQSPAFQGKFFSDADAAKIRKVLDLEYPTLIRQAANVLSYINALPRMMMTTVDVGAITLQGSIMISSHPVVWERATRASLKAMLSEKAMQNFIATHADTIKEWSPYGATATPSFFTETAMPRGMLSKIPVARTIARPFIRAFETYLEASRIYGLEAHGYKATTEADKIGVAKFWNEMSGITDTARMGIDPDQQALETAGLFAPRYTRAILAIMTDISKGGLRGKEARTALGRATLAGTFGYAGIAMMLGQEVHLDPRDRKFMTVSIAGQNIGPGGSYLSTTRAIVRMALEPERAHEIAGEYVRNKLSPVVGTAVRMYQYPYQYRDVLQITRNVVAQNLLPIWASSMLLEEGETGDPLVAGAAEFGGLRAYPDQPDTGGSPFDKLPVNPFSKPPTGPNPFQSLPKGKSPFQGK